MARGKVSIRREGSLWVCRVPTGFGFGPGEPYYFRTWREAMDAAVPPLGTPASADLQMSRQAQDAVGSIPMWTPVSYY